MAGLEGALSIAICSYRVMAHTYQELPSANQGGDYHITGRVEDPTSADQRHLSRVCAGGGRSLPEGVLRPIETVATDTQVLVIMERGTRAEVVEASSVSSILDMEDAT